MNTVKGLNMDVPGGQGVHTGGLGRGRSPWGPCRAGTDQKTQTERSWFLYHPPEFKFLSHPMVLWGWSLLMPPQLHDTSPGLGRHGLLAAHNLNVPLKGQT